MSYDLMINFNDIINNQAEILRYAGKNSDSFTVITTLKKPYSKRPPNFIHEKIMMELSPYRYLPLKNGLPEDICFYRKQKPWFGSVSHEKMAFMWNTTESDCANLERLSIKFSIQDKKVEKGD